MPSESSENSDAAVAEHLDLTYTPAVSDEHVRQIVDVLGKWQAIKADDHSEDRHSPRRHYRSKIILITEVPESFGKIDVPARIAFACWARDLSRSGIGVVSAAVLLPFQNVPNGPPMLHLEQILSEGQGCTVGMFAADSTLWLDACVARTRPFEGRLMEIGIQLLEKLDPEQVRISPALDAFLTALRRSLFSSG